MKAKLHELTVSAAKRSACNAHRTFPISLQESVGEYVEKAGVIKKTIHDIMIDKKDEKDVMVEFAAAFEDIPYPSDRQREVHGNDAWRQIKRYTGSEKRSLIEGIAQDIDMGDGLEVYVNPDYIAMTKVRGVRAAVKEMFERMKATAVRDPDSPVFINHADILERAEELAARLRAEFGTKEIYIDSLDLVIGAHSGPGTLALFFVGDHR